MERTRSSLYREVPRFVKHFVGCEAAREDLTEKLRNGVNTVAMGVEGVGKSAFFNSVFTPEYCNQMATEEHILINQISYPTDLATEDIYPFFAESVRDAAEVLDDCGEKSRYADIMARARQYREEDSGPHSYFQKICKYIRRKGYRVVLVIDQFERFTSSKYVLAEHHDVMRNVLADKNLCFVVATDYDFDKESLPQNVSGSLLLQLFAGHEIFLKGLNREECGLFLRGIGSQDDFTPEELGKLSRLTGGIPVLLCRAAYYALAQKERGKDIYWRGVKESVLRDYGSLMDRWLGTLTPQESDLLNELAGQIEEAVPVRADLRDGAVPLLLNRGLIVDLGDYCYDFNSRVFQDYCIRHSPRTRRPQNLLTLKPAPLPKPGPVHTGLEDLSSRLSWPAQSGVIYYEDKSTHVHNEGVTIAPGGVQVRNTVIQSHGLSISEVLNILDEGEDFQKSLAARLTECRIAGGLPALVPSLTEAEQEQQNQIYDEAFSKMGGNFLADLEVDEEQELVNVSAREVETLDDRFDQARTRCRRNLTDELLASMNERCRLYLKLSVVVEDALSVVGSNLMQDCSPHLVLYGKALEQALRDNLFELFQREERLSAYDTYTHREDRDSPNSFLNKYVEKTFIGNFTCLIRAQKNYLGKLCARQGIRAPEGVLSEQQWSDWWKDLQDHINAARVIRNLADHPDEQLPTTANLDRMCELLFGTTKNPGILARTMVGKVLFLNLFSPKIDFLKGKSLVGSRMVFRCLERTKRGGLKGCLRVGDWDYEASVSPLRVERYCASLSGADFKPVGAFLDATILEYRTEGDHGFFSLELLA